MWRQKTARGKSVRRKDWRNFASVNVNHVQHDHHQDHLMYPLSSRSKAINLSFFRWSVGPGSGLLMCSTGKHGTNTWARSTQFSANDHCTIYVSTSYHFMTNYLLTLLKPCFEVISWRCMARPNSKAMVLLNNRSVELLKQCDKYLSRYITCNWRILNILESVQVISHDKISQVRALEHGEIDQK